MGGLWQRLRRRRQPPVVTIVSGLPRSGTSMLMRMLEAGGLPPLTDEVRAPDVDNPRGYYEFERVKQLDKGDMAWLAEAEGRAVKVISALLKHLPSGYAYRVLFVRRDMSEILASQRKMLIRRDEDPDKVDEEEMASLFSRHVAEVTRWLAQQPRFSVLHVEHGQILRQPRAEAARINAFCGGTLDEAAMAAVVDPDLYRNRQAAAPD